MEFETDIEVGVTPPLEQGTKVVSKNQPDMKMTGVIAGIAQPRVPGYGFLYILKLDEASSQVLKDGAGKYAYDCIAVPESDIELAK